MSGAANGARSPDAPIGVIVPLPPSYRGGTEEYAYRLARGFARSEPTRALTTTVRWDPAAPSLDVGGASVERLPAREAFERPLLLRPAARSRLLGAVRSSKVVNLHMPFPLVEAPVARAAERASVPLVLTYHMDADLGAAGSGSGASWITGMYRRWSAHPALAKASAIVSNSRGYAERSPVLSQHLPKVVVIPKGVDVDRLGIPGADGRRLRPECVAADAVPDGGARVAFVGRLVPYKGVSVLLEASAELVRRGRNPTVLLAGKGPLREALEARAHALGLDGRIRFLGFVPDRQLGDLYRYADVTVVPSLGSLESSATTLEEAAACGCPVVGSALPGAAESIPSDGVRGRLVPPGDVAALADAIDRMLSQPRPAAPEQIRTWDDVVRDYFDLFRRLGVPLHPGAA